MLLIPTRQAMFVKMKQRDICRRLYRAGAAMAFFSLLLWGMGAAGSAGIYYAVLGTAVGASAFWMYRRRKREIMPVTGCFIRLEDGMLTVRQPKTDGKYESCRLLVSETGQAARGNRYKSPSFYIALKEGCLESRISDSDTHGRSVFLVKGEGYRRREFLALYRLFCRGLPKTVEHGDLRVPETWKREGADLFMACLYLLPVLLLLPVILYAVF